MWTQTNQPKSLNLLVTFTFFILTGLGFSAGSKSAAASSRELQVDCQAGTSFLGRTFACEFQKIQRRHRH